MPSRSCTCEHACVLQGLKEMGYDIISTGGTHAAIEKAGVPCQKVEDVTGFPEMLDGEQRSA